MVRRMTRSLLGASAVVLLLAVSAVAHAQDTFTVTNPGAGSVTVPAGYAWIDVTIQCWGGGGGGAYDGGGGGGGAYAYKTYVSLLAGTYSYYIAPGGYRATGEITAVLEEIQFGTTLAQDIWVTGGAGGSNQGSGGACGSVVAGTGYQGGTGGSVYVYDAGGGGGGSGGPSGPGGNGGNTPRNDYGGSGGAGVGAGGVGAGLFSGEASGGSFPGGGGGGGDGDVSIGTSGAGGEIIVTYTPACSGVWSAGGGGSWGTLTSDFGTNWGGAGYSSPGLNPSFPSTDTATFGGSVASGTATVTLDGASPSVAVLTFSNTNASFSIAQGSGGTLSLNAGSGTAPISVQGNHAIAAPLALAGNVAVTTVTAADSLALSGVISGPGGLQQNGPGTVVLQGTGSYFGPTTVNGGKLEVDGWLTNSAVTLNSGGILSGTGSLLSVTLDAGGQLAPGDPTGTLSLSGTLTLQSGAKMAYQLSGAPTGNMVLMPTGQLVLSDQQFSDFTFSTLRGFAPGTYTLIDAGSISGSLGTNVSGFMGGYPATLAIVTGGPGGGSDQDLVLEVTPEPSTFVLLGVAAVGLLGYAWRQRRKPSSPSRETCRRPCPCPRAGQDPHGGQLDRPVR